MSCHPCHPTPLRPLITPATWRHHPRCDLSLPSIPHALPLLLHHHHHIALNQAMIIVIINMHRDVAHYTQSVIMRRYKPLIVRMKYHPKHAKTTFQSLTNINTYTTNPHYIYIFKHHSYVYPSPVHTSYIKIHRTKEN